MPRRLLIWVPFSLVTFLAVCIVPPHGPDTAVARPLPSGPSDSGSGDNSGLWIQMKNVNLHVDEDHVMHVRSLRGQVEPTTPGSIPFLDEPESFRIRVTSGVVGLTGDDLAGLLNGWVFAYSGSPLRNLKARVEGSSVVLSGTMRKGLDLPFEMTASLTLEPDGRIRSHPTGMKILGVNGNALLHAFGLRLDKVLDLKGSRGATVEGDDLLLEPTKIIPPPSIAGRLASIGIEGDQIVQTFVETGDDAAAGAAFRPDAAAKNYIYFRGGKLRFGKLTMTDTDLLIVDADQSNAFDMYMSKYNVQLVASNTKNLPNLGLRVSMPDFARVKDSPVANTARK